MTEASYPLWWEADVLLRDGRPVRLRPITPADGDALRRFHASLSARTVYFRFFSAKPELSDRDVAYFTTVDHVSRVAFVAIDMGEIIGVGRFDVVDDGSAEVAFLIRDEVQGLGLGSILLEHLAEAARERGVRRFVAEVLPANARMLGTFREAGYVLSQHLEQDVIAVSFDLEPTADSLAVMAAREHRAEARSVQRLLQPRSVAVVGASRRPGGLGHQVLRNIVDGGFTGDVVAVHPEVSEIAGVRCVRSLAEAGADLDLAVVVVPADSVADVIAEAGAAGVHGLVVVSGGFGDAGSGGQARQAALVQVAHGTGMRVVGPNALGLINTDPAVHLNASLVARMPLPGRVGFFSQSGALGSAILDRFAAAGLGVSTFVSAGNRADVSGNDLLQYWQDDEQTDVVLLYLESIGNARKFARLVHRLSQAKPVVMVRAGGVDHQHPLGHAVASTTLAQRAVDQVLADCGLLVVDDIDSLIDVGRLLASQPLPTGPRVAVVGNSDALAVMAANAMAGATLSSSGPAVTFPRDAPAAAFERAVHDAMQDSDVDAVLVIYVAAVEGDADAEICAALRACRLCGDPHAKPVVAVMHSAVQEPRDGTVPVFSDVEDAVHALAAAVRLGQWREHDRVVSLGTAADREEPVDKLEAPPAGDLVGDRAARLLGDAGRTPVMVDLESSGTLGFRIRLETDPLFGPVVVVGADDAVAEVLDDRAYRLAPVSRLGAAAMLRSLGALDVTLRSATDPERVLDGLSVAVSDVSRLHLRVPGVSAADLRHATIGPGGDLTVGEILVTVSEAAVTADPTARRM